jgi:hypothetical protein
MNDFEKQLQRQPMRKIPADWRAEILAEAKRHSPQPNIHRESPAHMLLRGLGRFILTPKWSVLAAAWVAIFVLEFSSRDTHGTTVMASSQPAPVRAETLMAIRQQQMLLSELTGTPSAIPNEPADVPKFKPQPRSQGFQTQAVA